MIANENYLNEPQDTEFKRTIASFIKEFKEFREDTKKQLNEIISGRELKENKYKHTADRCDKDNPDLRKN